MHPLLTSDLCREHRRELLAEAEQARLVVHIIHARVVEQSQHHLEDVLCALIMRWGLRIRIALAWFGWMSSEQETHLPLPRVVVPNSPQMAKCSPFFPTTSSILENETCEGRNTHTPDRNEENSGAAWIYTWHTRNTKVMGDEKSKWPRAP